MHSSASNSAAPCPGDLDQLLAPETWIVSTGESALRRVVARPQAVAALVYVSALDRRARHDYTCRGPR